MPDAPILLIDDNPEDLELTQRLLAKSGISNPIVTVDGGEQALVFLRDCVADGASNLPELILCDVRMPRVNGFDVLKWVRNQSAFDKVFFVMHSGGDVPADRARAAALGAAKFLVKFPTGDEMRHIVRQAVTVRAAGPAVNAPVI